MRRRLPDFYVPELLFTEYITQGGQVSPSTAGLGTANKAFYVPVTFPVSCQLKSISMVASNGTGNYDIGFYDGWTLNKLATKGSTAMTAAGTKTLTFSPEIRVTAGHLYYAAVSLSSTSGNVWVINAGSLPLCVVAGLGYEASALPLPSVMTPVVGATNFSIPIFIFGIR